MLRMPTNGLSAQLDRDILAQAQEDSSECSTFSRAGVTVTMAQIKQKV